MLQLKQKEQLGHPLSFCFIQSFTELDDAHLQTPPPNVMVLLGAGLWEMVRIR